MDVETVMELEELYEVMSEEDWELAGGIVRGSLWKPDLDIRPLGKPYLYRWFVIPRNKLGNVYFHIQVADDPQRPLHDHPWDNQSVILAGGYDEVYQERPENGGFSITRAVRAGMTVHRKATCAHRLLMPENVHYTMTLFSTGPVLRKWGYWVDGKFIDHERFGVVNTADGRSIVQRGE